MFDLLEFEEIIVHYLDTGKHSLAKKAVKLGLEQHPSSVDLKLLDVEILIFDNKLEKEIERKIKDIYTTSVDYNARDEATVSFLSQT